MAEKHSSLKHKLASILWVDSASMAGWKPAEGTDSRLDYILSVGFVVAETEDAIALTTSISGWWNAVDVITIPKVAIVRRGRVPLDHKAILGKHLWREDP